MIDLSFTDIDLIVHPADRYVAAHQGAEQVALAVIAAVGGPVRGRPDVWDLLTDRAPEMAEWAAFFGYLAPRVAVVAAGEIGIVGEREADDLARDLRNFTAQAGQKMHRMALRRNVS
ncbi:MAG: SAV_6107 family HEPN domain-containing protein [Arachnia sp.]